MNKVRTINVTQTVRPIRLGFLVSPSDTENLLKIFQLNCSLWGGQFNGIIPLLKKTPTWWGGRKEVSASEIMNGYIDAFEPDYLVVINEKDKEVVNFSKERILILEDLLIRSDDAPPLLRANLIMEELYDKIFKFKLRNKPKVINPIHEDAKDEAFCAAIFGNFPELKYGKFREHYSNIFKPEDQKMNGDNYFKTIIERKITPFSLTIHELEVRGPWSRGPILFLMDINQNSDLIDFWNLRAVGKRIFPVATKWIDVCKEEYINFVNKNHVPLKNNPYGLMTDTNILKSRRSKDSDLAKFQAILSECPKGSITTQTWQPRIWDAWAREHDCVTRGEIYNYKKSEKCYESDGEVEFKILEPSFAREIPWAHKPVWASVIEFRNYSSHDDMACIFPPNLPKMRKLLSHTFSEEVISTTDGLVSLCSRPDKIATWKTTTGHEVFEEWFKNKGFLVEKSVAGKIAAQVINALDGIFGVRLIANKEIIELLDKMSHGLVEVPIQQEAKGKPLARSRTTNWSEWWNLLKKIGGNEVYAKNVLNSMVDKGILRLGINITCTICDQKNWYPLNGISDSLICESCLSNFPFPISKPPEKAWHFRTRGPFSIENYAHGSYTVALALRFLTETVNAEATWTTGIKIKNKNIDLECDFAIWRKSERFKKGTLHQIFGECKSFGEFKPIDAKRTKSLAEIFPGSILVFATLRKELTAKEKKMIGKVAKWGRNRIGPDKWKAPVLILTAHELFGSERIPACWQEAGGAMATFAKNWGYDQDIINICDATQQLHLNMKSDSEEMMAKYDKKRSKARKT